jgi:hypothetical protein
MKVLRTEFENPDIGLQAVVQPATNVVACRPPTVDYLMMTATSAQISCPTVAAWLLPVNVTLQEPLGLA